MSHLLILALDHALLFLPQGAISHMVTLLLALEASDESLVLLLFLPLDFGIVGLVLLVGFCFKSTILVLLIFTYMIQVTCSARKNVCLRAIRVSTR